MKIARLGWPSGYLQELLVVNVVEEREPRRVNGKGANNKLSVPRGFCSPGGGGGGMNNSKQMHM